MLMIIHRYFRVAAMNQIPTDRIPSHPGQILLEDFLVPMDISQRQLAEAIQVPFQRVNEIINGKRGVTPATALRLSRYFGTSAAFWLNLQSRWDLYFAQQKEARTLEEIQPHNLNHIGQKSRTMAMVYRKSRIGKQQSDRHYWLSRPPEERLAALEQIRQEYHAWKYGTEPGFQRVLTITKRQ